MGATVRKGTVIMNGCEKSIDAVLVKGGSRMLVCIAMQLLDGDISKFRSSELGSGNSIVTSRDIFPGRMTTPLNMYVRPAKVLLSMLTFFSVT
jgi:hypothetical protein